MNCIERHAIELAIRHNFDARWFTRLPQGRYLVNMGHGVTVVIYPVDEYTWAAKASN